MIPEEMLGNEVLRQAAEQYAEAVITGLPAPEECNHRFSKRFEEKMHSFINNIGTKYYTVAIRDSLIHK